MPHNRYYLDAPFEENAIVRLSGDEWHHLARVQRAKVGDGAELVNGRGQLAEAEVVELRKSDAALSLQRIIDAKPSPPLILGLAIPRMNHLEWVIEKGTELGATAFWLFPGLLSEKTSLSDSQQARLKNLSIAAMKQCGRLDLPEILLKPPLLEWKEGNGSWLFGDLSDNAPYLWEMNKITSPVMFLVGPEKGFDPRESSHLLQILHAKGVRLHPNILRAETAPLCALAQLQHHLNCKSVSLK
jgi:16S rRNA (uracil1498-N3)-methyltransferase